MSLEVFVDERYVVDTQWNHVIITMRIFVE